MGPSVLIFNIYRFENINISWSNIYRYIVVKYIQIRKYKYIKLGLSLYIINCLNSGKLVFHENSILVSQFCDLLIRKYPAKYYKSRLKVSRDYQQLDNYIIQKKGNLQTVNQILNLNKKMYNYNQAQTIQSQGYNARKVNCSCVFSGYILKPVLSGWNL